jgi:HK97 family phage prohead protease
MWNKLDNPIEHCDLKFAPGEQSGKFTGYASVFGSVDAMGDTVVRGAFTETLKDRARPPLMLFGHNPGRPLGIWTDLAEDDVGLKGTGEFTPGNTDAQNIRASMKHGAIDGLSIGFRVPEGGADEKDGGGRVLKKIQLVEISVVSMPAETNARVDTTTVKSEILSLASLRDCDLFLREAGGWSRSMTKDFLGQLQAIFQREAEMEAREEIILRLGSVADRASQISELLKKEYLT